MAGGENGLWSTDFKLLEDGVRFIPDPPNPLIVSFKISLRHKAERNSNNNTLSLDMVLCEIIGTFLQQKLYSMENQELLMQFFGLELSHL